MLAKTPPEALKHLTEWLTAALNAPEMQPKLAQQVQSRGGNRRRIVRDRASSRLLFPAVRRANRCGACMPGKRKRTASEASKAD